MWATIHQEVIYPSKKDIADLSKTWNFLIYDFLISSTTHKNNFIDNIYSNYTIPGHIIYPLDRKCFVTPCTSVSFNFVRILEILCNSSGAWPGWRTWLPFVFRTFSLSFLSWDVTKYSCHFYTDGLEERANILHKFVIERIRL